METSEQTLKIILENILKIHLKVCQIKKMNRLEQGQSKKNNNKQTTIYRESRERLHGYRRLVLLAAKLAPKCLNDAYEHKQRQ